MIKLIRDPLEIERLAEKLEEENYKFREFLKWELSWSDKKLDALFSETSQWVSEQIDCTECANCCKEAGTGLDEKDIKRLAKRLAISTEEFESRYVTTGEWKEKQIEQVPCPFLEGCRCSVYEDRPADCREYPHLDKKDMRSRSLGLIENASYCPLVFNTLEMLKVKLNWKKSKATR